MFVFIWTNLSSFWVQMKKLVWHIVLSSQTSSMLFHWKILLFMVALTVTLWFWCHLDRNQHKVEIFNICLCCLSLGITWTNKFDTFLRFHESSKCCLAKKNMFCVLVSAVTVCFYIILTEFSTIWVFVFTWSQWSFFPHKQTNVMCCFPFNFFNMIWNVLLGQMWRWRHQDCDWRTWLLRTQICLNSNVIGHIMHVTMGRNHLCMMYPNH